MWVIVCMADGWTLPAISFPTVFDLLHTNHAAIALVGVIPVRIEAGLQQVSPDDEHAFLFIVLSYPG